VNPNFVAHSVEMQSGLVVSGLVVAETSQTLVLKRADGREEQLPVADVLEVRSTGQSLMPEGFEQKLSREALIDLLEFLRTPGRELLREAEREDARDE